MNTATQQRNQGKEIAAIDLGSNSFHMIIARIVNDSVQIISRLKQKVQLAEGLDENAILSQQAIERGVKCLALFAERLQGFPVENVNVVGTYTLRRAVNNDEFLRQAKMVFPYPINIISGKTEAKTIYAGVSHTQPERGRKLVIDIGGGSTEMIIGENFTPLIAESRHMGCVSFAKKFFPQGEISRQNFNQAKQSAVDKIEDLGWEYRKLGWQSVLGSSGTIKTVQQVISANLCPTGIITPPHLEKLIEQTLQAKHFTELNIPNLNPERIDIFVPGLAILSAVFQVFQLERMRYSDGALREGIIYSIEKNFQVSDIRHRTAMGLTTQFNLDQAQANRVQQSAELLANQYEWQDKNNGEEIKHILYWAARLHEVGLVINHKGLEKHSHYILQNMELPGFDREQKKLLVTLVRHHIGSFKTNEIASFSRYSQTEVITAMRMLRLAVILNKSRQATQPTRHIHLNTAQNGLCWSLYFDQHYLNRNPLIYHELCNESRILNENEMGLSFS